MSSSVPDRLVSRWIVVSGGVIGLVSFLIGATGVYFDIVGAANWQAPLFLGFWGIEFALLLGAVASVQALWSLFRRSPDVAQSDFYVLLSLTGLGAALSAMVAVIAAFLWVMSSPTSILFGNVAAIGLGVTLLFAVGAFAEQKIA